MAAVRLRIYEIALPRGTVDRPRPAKLAAVDAAIIQAAFIPR